MKYIPILFSTPMVQAILEGRKTQTRRLVKPQPKTDPQTGDRLIDKGPFGQEVQPWDEYIAFHKGGGSFCKYGKVGDVLWVRETWTQNGLKYYRFKADYKKGEGLFTSESVPEKYRNKWKPGIHMPKEAARIFLEITNVRVERLHDIQKSDIYSEGAMSQQHIDQGSNAFTVWSNLWQSINGPESWEANPWVWVIEFKRIEKPTQK